MPWPGVSRISYLGQREPFEELRGQMKPWGPDVELLEPNAELRWVLLALGVPAEALNRVDTYRLQEQLARQRAA